MWGRLTLNRKCLVVSMIYDTLWWTNSLQWKMAIEIEDFPIKNGGSFYMLVHQRVWHLALQKHGWTSDAAAILASRRRVNPGTFLLFGRLCHSATWDGSGVPSWQRSNTISPITWVTSGQVLSHPGRLPTRTNSDSATYVDSATNDSSTYPVGFSNEYGRIQQQMWSDSATNPIQKLMIRKQMSSDSETNSSGFRNWRFPIQKRSRIQKLIHRNISFRMQVHKFPVIHPWPSKSPRFVFPKIFGAPKASDVLLLRRWASECDGGEIWRHRGDRTGGESLHHFERPYGPMGNSHGLFFLGEKS